MPLPIRERQREERMMERDRIMDQATLWNGPSGQAWIDLQEPLDRMYQPIQDLLVEAVSARASGSVLDLGCGTGGTTIAVARVLGARGGCIGLDISEPMIAFARKRAEREHSSAGFITADAQTHVFEPASFDMIISRFGVMFFDDPVRAFGNLRRAARKDAELRFVAWRSPQENPFMTTAERVAAPLLPALPARQPNAPGQFAFADDRRVHSILQESGWTGIAIRPLDMACTLPEKDLALHFTRLGPVALFLRETDAPTRTRVVSALRAAFEHYVHGEEVRFTAACWMVSARAPST
jgi:SAM-dependent methyltransferase